jgi:ribosomal 30S subunit maturation factor RimM
MITIVYSVFKGFVEKVKSKLDTAFRYVACGEGKTMSSVLVIRLFQNSDRNASESFSEQEQEEREKEQEDDDEDEYGDEKRRGRRRKRGRKNCYMH